MAQYRYIIYILYIYINTYMYIILNAHVQENFYRRAYLVLELYILLNICDFQYENSVFELMVHKNIHELEL